MNDKELAQSLAAGLESRLAEMERLGALIAAAHLEAAIESLRRQFGLQREASVTD